MQKQKVPINILLPYSEVKTSEDDQMFEERSQHKRQIKINTRTTQRKEERQETGKNKPPVGILRDI